LDGMLLTIKILFIVKSKTKIKNDVFI
jgi:hypothetical protein